MPGEPTILSTRDGYDRWSEVYDSEINPLIVLEEPIVDRLLGSIAGLAVADIGCGTGRHALRLAAAGARVTGVDFSRGMLDKARAKPGADRVTFVEHDLARPLPLPDRSFDRVLCALVVDHVADLPGLFTQLARICKPGGRIIVTCMHPAMMLKGVQARFTDPGTGQETRPRSVPNQISDYLTAAISAGLTLDHISEHITDETLVAKAPRAEKHRDWPMLLAMRFTP